MKLLVIVFLFSSLAVAWTKKAKPVLPEHSVKAEKQTKVTKEILGKDKKEADCDKKAEKPVEIIPEKVSLGGNAGCTLDEAH